MDRLTYDARIARPTILDLTLRQSADLIERWHGRDGGRLRYAFTPRFAVSCTADMLREIGGAGARDRRVLADPPLRGPRRDRGGGRGCSPRRVDYVDVYDRAGGLGPKTMLAHAVHLSDRELARLVETGAHVAHCPASNLFLASGVMPLARYLEAGLSVGLGSDVAAGPDVASVRRCASGRTPERVAGDARRHAPVLAPLDWLRLGSLEGARALGLADVTGSLEEGKEADLVVIDPSATAAIDDDGGLAEVRDALADPSLLVSRLMFRANAAMVRGTYVRGRRLASSA